MKTKKTKQQNSTRSYAAPSNFPSEFSYGERHNISLKDNSNELSQIPNGTSDNPDIRRNF
jgi:hypothetical protein